MADRTTHKPGNQREIHAQVREHLRVAEELVDLLKDQGPHPLDGNNALRNIADRSEDLARRARRGL